MTVLKRTAWPCLWFILGLGACRQIEHPRTVDPGAPLAEDTRSRTLTRTQFSDIPVPLGFSYITRENQSFSYSQGGVRVGRFRYWGHTSPAETAEFYRQTMPMHAYAWEFMTQSPGDGGSTLRFRKDRQTCEVTIHEEAGTTYVDLFVTGPAS